MNKEYILTNIKKQLELIVTEVDFDNYQSIQEELSNHFEIIHTLKKIKIRDSDNVVSAEPYPKNNMSSEENEESLSVNNKQIYIVERRLRGFFVPEIEAFIPESIARKLGIQHNDFVSAKHLGNGMFEYEIAKKGEGGEPYERQQYNLCVVKTEAGNLVVSETIEGEDIRVNDLPYTVLLNDEDIIQFNIDDGDVIDIAFPKDEPIKHKVMWKHSTDSVIKQTSERNTSKRSAKSTESKVQKEQVLKEQVIYIVGNEPKKDIYKEKIEELGGEFLFGDAKDDYISHEANVRKSDKVIFLLKYSGHTGMKQVKSLCKKIDVPFLPTFNTGITNVLRIAETGEISNDDNSLI